MLIKISTKAEIVRQFTDGAEATHLVTNGCHISHTSEGSGSEGYALIGSLFPEVVGNAESYYSSHPFFKNFDIKTLWKILKIVNSNC